MTDYPTDVTLDITLGDYECEAWFTLTWETYRDESGRKVTEFDATLQCIDYCDENDNHHHLERNEAIALAGIRAVDLVECYAATHCEETYA